MFARHRLIAVVLCGNLSFAVPSHADVAMPTETTIFFEHKGKPVEAPVDFHVSCLGVTVWPGHQEDTPKERSEVFSFGGSCPAYGCKIHENFYMNYMRIDSCSMSGRVGSKPFEIQNYGKSPIDFSVCVDRGDAAEAHVELPADIFRFCKAKFVIP